MKINMHEETPIQVRPKMTKKLIIIFWTWIGIIIGLLDFCLCYYAQQYLTALILTILIFVVIFICWLSIMDLKNSYIDIDENKIIVVEYNLGIRKTKLFLISEIHHITYSNGDALAIRGTRSRYTEYIILRDVKENYLFKIIDTPGTRELFQNLIESNS